MKEIFKWGKIKHKSYKFPSREWGKKKNRNDTFMKNTVNQKERV